MPSSEPHSHGLPLDAAAALAAVDGGSAERPPHDPRSAVPDAAHHRVASSEAMAAAVAALRTETDRLSALGQSLQRAEHQWVEKYNALEVARLRTERSRRKLAARLWRLRRQKQAWPAGAVSDLGASPRFDARADEAAEEELQMLRGQLAEAAAMLEAFRESQHQEAPHHASRADNGDDEFSDELESLRGQLHGLLSEDQDADRALGRLREELAAERIRCEELESQNASLAALVANSQVHRQISADTSTASLESLSWEQRKAAILYQLSREDQDDPIDASERESLREAVARTDREIQRRDNEIAELRQLLESQSTTLGGSVAVGAAAIAEMIDADELVQEEREKLQAIKAEWQEKLRKAEIDLSLERAKLARERRELEQKHAELQDQLAHIADQVPAAASPDQPRRRRWLTQLGLSESEGE